MSVPGTAMPPALTESAEMLRRLAAAAHVAVRGLEVGGKASRKVARVERRRDGFWIVFQQRMLEASEPARLFVLAHEVAHIALDHRRIRRRLRFALIAVIPLASVGFGLVLGLQIVRDANPWLLRVESALWLTVILSPRAILLAVARRHEYQADSMAVRLLGSPDGAVAFFDWVATLKPYVVPFPLRLWGSTHPSNDARLRTLLRGTSASFFAQPTSGR